MSKINLSSFLFESPIKIWKAKQTDLSQEQFLKAEEYFKALTGPLKDYFRKDLTSLSFDQIELLYLSIKEAKNFGIGASKGGSWLTNQILLNPLLIFQDIKEDYIPVLVSYNRNLKSPEVKNLNLDEVPNIQELNRILNSLESEICFTASEAELGKVVEKGGWEVFLPTTTEASIILGKRGCGKRDNVWCTTREDGRNLFLNHALIQKVTLFYVIKKNTCADKGNPEHKMSVGFINGEPRFNMGKGRITVDAENENLTFERFQRVLGEELANEFLEAMKQKAGSLGGKHPAFKEAEMLVASPKRFIQKFEGYSDDENGDEARRQIVDFALGSNKTHKNVLNYLATLKDPLIREAIAVNPTTPVETIIQLSKDSIESVREAAAENPNLPIEVFAKLALSTSVSMRNAVAKNKKAPEDVLEILAGDKDQDVRFYVAQNLNTPVEVLEILARDKDQGVRVGIARNPNTPVETIIQLSKDSIESVREAAAENPNLPAEIFAKLALSTSVSMRNAVARNKKAPEDILRILAGDKDTYVRIEVAQNQSTPEDILIILARDENSSVLTAVAKNPNTPENALRILAGDKNRFVHIGIAQNPNTPREILIKLANDPDEYIRSTAIENARNRNIPLQESKHRRNKLKLLSILF